MWPDRISNPGPLALESDALPTALRGPANINWTSRSWWSIPENYQFSARLIYDTNLIRTPFITDWATPASQCHTLARSLGQQRWLYNNPFPPSPGSSCPSWANSSNVHPCPLLNIVFLPLCLSTSSFSFHFALQNCVAQPAGTWLRNDVVTEATRCHDVASTLVRRHFESCAFWFFLELSCFFLQFVSIFMTKVIWYILLKWFIILHKVMDVSLKRTTYVSGRKCLDKMD